MLCEPHNSEDPAAPLLVRAEPPDRAEELCRRLVDRVRVAGDVLELNADPALAGPINTVLVMKGVTVSELHRAA